MINQRNKFFYFVSRRRQFFPVRNGAKASENRVHASPDPWAREGVPLQPILDTAETHRDRPRALFVRTANQNLVPEPTDEVQKGQQVAQHEECPTQDEPRRRHDHRQSENDAIGDAGQHDDGVGGVELVILARGRNAGPHGRGPFSCQQHELASQPTAAAATPLRRRRCPRSTPSPPPDSSALRRRRQRSKQLSTSRKSAPQAGATLRTHVVVNWTNFWLRKRKRKETSSSLKTKQKLMLKQSPSFTVVTTLWATRACVSAFIGILGKNRSSSSSDRLIHWK